MDSLEVIASRLVGTWHSVLVSDEASDGYFRILEDLTYVAIFPWVPPNARHPYHHMRMWCELESESVLRMRFYKESPGDVRDLHFEGDTLVFQMTLQPKDGATEPQQIR